jgi:hypothetical protein
MQDKSNEPAENTVGARPIDDDLLSEYQDLSSNLRHHSNLRFAQLTLFVAVTGGLIGVIFAKSPALALAPKAGLKIFGLITTLTFFVMEERTALFWRSFHRRAIQLERLLGYRQYTDQPPRHRVITAHNATRLLYISAAAFWMISLIWWHKF